MLSNQFFHADCLSALANLPAATAHLIYLDPPFNTKVKRSYDDNFGNAHDYVAYMQPRVTEMLRVLTPGGRLFFNVWDRIETSEFTDTVVQGQGQRGICELRFRYPGSYMFHAHKTEFADLGWMGMFEAVADPATG